MRTAGGCRCDALADTGASRCDRVSFRCLSPRNCSSAARCIMSSTAIRHYPPAAATPPFRLGGDSIPEDCRCGGGSTLRKGPAS